MLTATWRPYICPFWVLNIGRERQLNSTYGCTSPYFFLKCCDSVSSVIMDIYPL